MEAPMSYKRNGATYYTVTEMANKLGVHRNTVLYWIEKKQVKAVRSGMAAKSPWVIHEDELQRVMEIVT